MDWQSLKLDFFPPWSENQLALDFTLEFMKYFTHEGNVNLACSMLAGACAGIGFWSCIYPVDYIKTLIQGDSLVNPQYRGSWHCAQE